jgi:uncharacterized protein with NRDE domain
MTLPDTGVGIEWERVLSPILITTPQYGTRTSTILSMTEGGAMFFVEHTRTPDGAVSHVAKFDFELCPP